MEKIKEYAGVPKKYILIVSVVSLVFAFVYHPLVMSSWSGLLVFCLYLLGALAVMTVVHELLHGVWFKAFTGHVTFGFILKKFVFYASAPREKLTRNQFILVALFPQVIAVPCLLVAMLNHNPMVNYLAVVVLFMNLAGGTSDIWAAITIARYKKEAMVEDTKTGMVVYQKA